HTVDRKIGFFTLTAPEKSISSRHPRSPCYFAVPPDTTDQQCHADCVTHVIWVAVLAAPDVRITSGLTTLQCAMLIETLDAHRSQNVAGKWWCIPPEEQQFLTAKEMGIKARILRNPSPAPGPADFLSGDVLILPERHPAYRRHEARLRPWHET